MNFNSSISFIQFTLFVSIHSFQVLHFSSFFSIPSFQFINFNSFISSPLFQVLHFNSFMSIHSCQFIPLNSFISTHSFQVIEFNSFISIHSFHAFYFISWHFISIRFFPTHHEFLFSHVPFRNFRPGACRLVDNSNFTRTNGSCIYAEWDQPSHNCGGHHLVIPSEKQP